MSEPITVRYRWTADELLTSFRWHFRQRVRPIMRVAYWAMAVLFITVGASKWWGTHALFPGGMLFLVGLNVPFLILVVVPWMVRRRFAKRPDRNAEVEWSIAPATIRVRTQHGSSEFAWAALAKVTQTPAGFLFYSTDQIFHWLPRHGFRGDTDFERLSQLAQQNAAAFRRIG